MKKQILNIGQTLSKAEQKQVSGGNGDYVDTFYDCRLHNHQCGGGAVCDSSTGNCVTPGGGSNNGPGAIGFCVENVGQDCNSDH